jgi:hypothetical protein
MPMVRVTPGVLRTCFGLKLAFSVLLLAPACRAQAPASTPSPTPVDVSGSYQCTQVKVQGKVADCKAAPLILKNDGHFELRGWEGTYLVEGQWVQLSDALTKARAKIEPGHKIVLKFYGKKGWAEMTYERRVAELGKKSLT